MVNFERQPQRYKLIIAHALLGYKPIHEELLCTTIGVLILIRREERVILYLENKIIGPIPKDYAFSTDFTC